MENLGLKAVAAGAKPEDLQQAYVTAQVSGNWQKLESVISNALGPEAIKYQGVGNPITGVTNLFNNFLGILCFEDYYIHRIINHSNCFKLMSKHCKLYFYKAEGQQLPK